MTSEQPGTGRLGRWERRERRRRSAKERLQKHGASLKRIYADAIRKRAATRRKQK